MTTRHEDRAAAVQPELPLGASARRPAPRSGRSEAAPRRTPRRSGTEDEDRLDEHTRAIGRRGIAAARARLAATASATAALSSPDRGTEVSGDDRRSPERRRMAGRAA